MRPDIDDDIENRTRRTAHQLMLLVRRGLMVQSTQRAFAGVVRHAALLQRGAETLSRKFIETVCTRKEAALIGEQFHVDEKCARQWCLSENHRVTRFAPAAAA